MNRARIALFLHGGSTFWATAILGARLPVPAWGASLTRSACEHCDFPLPCSSSPDSSHSLASRHVDTTDTKLLTEPAISASHIAFIYAGISILLT